jgi:hypothetical protein
LQLAAAGALTAVALGACGSHAATRQDVIARGNAICAGALRDLRVIPPAAAGQTSASALAAYLKRALPILEGEATSLRALPRPAEERALLNSYIAAMTSAVSAYRSLGRAAQGGDQAGVDAALAALRGNGASVLAARYGLTQCATAAGTAVSR